MAFFNINPTTLSGDLLKTIQQNTPMNVTMVGGKLRTVVDVITDNMARMYNQFDTISLNSFVYGASGEYLDYIGSLFGLTRKKEFNASTYNDATNVKFYVPYGTFGDINNSLPITIPYGTRLWAQIGDSIVEYTTTSGYSLDPSDSEQYISVSCRTSGSAGNISANALRYYDNIEYAKKSSNLLLLTNIYPIANGVDSESDEDFRYRIVNFHTSSKTSNMSAIESAAYSFPNVAEVKLIKKGVSASTSLLLIKSVTPTISGAELYDIQAAVDAVSPAGYKIKVIAPEYLYMEFKFKISFASTTSLDAKNALKSQIAINTGYYINNLDVGQSFDYNEFLSYLVNTTPNIAGYISSGIISQINIIKPIFDTTTKFSVLGNYEILPTQKLLLSTSSTAIVFE